METNNPQQGDLLQPPPAQPPASELSDLQAQVRSLRTLFLLAAGSLFIMGLGLFYFHYSRVSDTRAQLESLRLETQRNFAGYKANTEPLVSNFVNRLQGFAVTNRDLLPLLEKYRPVLGPYVARGPAGSTNRPAHPPAGPR